MFCSYKGFGYIFNTIYTTVIRESFPVWQFFSGIISCMTVSFCRKNPGCRILCLWRISLNNIGLSCSQDSGSYLLPCFSFSDKSIHFFLHSWKNSPYILLNYSESSNNFKFFYQLWFYALPWHDIFVNYLSKFFVIFVNYLSHSLLTSGIC